MSVVDPGYKGAVHPGLYNAGGVPVTIELGARYINAMFIEIKGESKSYRGQWQGGRVATGERETQI
jgi:deoxycytidine triphosphate deaminase